MRNVPLKVCLQWLRTKKATNRRPRPIPNLKQRPTWKKPIFSKIMIKLKTQIFTKKSPIQFQTNQKWTNQNRNTKLNHNSNEYWDLGPFLDKIKREWVVWLVIMFSVSSCLFRRCSGLFFAKTGLYFSMGYYRRWRKLECCSVGALVSFGSKSEQKDSH